MKLRYLAVQAVFGALCFAAGGILTPRIKNLIAGSGERPDCRSDSEHITENTMQAEELSSRADEAKEIRTEFEPADYKGIRIAGEGMSREQITERLIRTIVDAVDIRMPEEDLEAETDYQLNGMIQRIKYQGFADPNAPRLHELDLENLREEIRLETIREFREERLIKAIIKNEKLAATPDELAAEAERISVSQQSSMEMIRKFFGEDYAGLTSDVLRRKAREFIYDNAVIE